MYQGTLEPISNRADWEETIELVNDDTDETITDLTGASVKVEVRDRDCWSPLLTRSTESGTVSIEGGVITWRFSPSDLRNLCAGTYDVGITISRDGLTDQLLIATLPVIDGVVRS